MVERHRSSDPPSDTVPVPSSTFDIFYTKPSVPFPAWNPTLHAFPPSFLPSSPSPLLQLLPFVHVSAVDAHHRFSKVLADLRQYLGVLVMRRSLNDRPRPRGRVPGFEDAAPNENTVAA